MPAFIEDATKAGPATKLDLPECPLYHTLSALQFKQGYYPNINGAQLDAAKEVLQIIISENLNFNSDEEWEFLKILRFLRARKFNVQETVEMIRADIIWREVKGFKSAADYKSPSDILNCDVAQVYKFLPTWVQGFDKQMRPVSWRKLGQLDMKSLLNLATMEQLVDLHTWDVEQLLRLTYDQCESTGYNIETFTIVIDVAGWTVAQASRDAYTFIKGMIAVDSDHYPERLGSVIIINAPAMLSWAWRIVQGFLADSQKAKVRIFGCDVEEWQSVIFEMMGEDQIPVEYGGTLPNLTLKESLATLEPRPVEEDDGSMQLLCGVPTMRRRQKTVKRRMEIVTAPATPAELEDDSEASPQRPAWTQLFTCSPPRCDGGDDNADYFISSSGVPGDEREDEEGCTEEKKEEEEMDPTNFASDWEQKSVANPPVPVKIFYSEDTEVPGPGNPKAASMKPPAEAAAVPPKEAKVVSTRCKSCSVM